MAQATVQKNELMEKLLQDAPTPLRVRPGETVEGKVVFRGKNKLLIDIDGVAVGIVSGRELRDSFNTFKDLKVGDEVMALVLEEENDEGMVVLSLRMASQQKAWDKFHELIDSEGTMKFIAQEANKGGLLANIDGIRTFLPVSQLAPVHYPRVNNADSSEIIHRLSKYIGHTFTVKIITMDEEAGKIVVSEREAMAEERSKSLESLHIGDEKDGMVTGIVKFGIFVAFDGLEGLVHISEIAWGHVKNPSEHAQVGDKVRVKIIGLDGDKLSLSIKQLTKDPWEEIAERYPVGKKVQGSVVRFADYGAFLKLEKDINGLVHLTELSHHKVEDASEVLKIGQKVDAQVINIDVDERRIGLSVKALLPIDKETLERIKREQAEEEAKKKDSEESEESEAKKAEQLSMDIGDAPDAAFVASKTGKKYYTVDSAAGQKIKEENRVYFKDEKEAEAAGFSA
ncbi:MAG: S1 RNA-binding domain-containing protein [Candidatus Peregrinibacteria bacterium]|nr:S1 RNA-binding domain-containing protein [Candidatus Peregrinibacteria bacterium]MCB9808277.1 S1 RNA-binding domain-containing protein [Candidatus Peribacteria bacterium]